MSNDGREMKTCPGCGWWFFVAAGEASETCGMCMDNVEFEMRHGMEPALKRMHDADEHGGAA